MFLLSFSCGVVPLHLNCTREPEGSDCVWGGSAGLQGGNAPGQRESGWVRVWGAGGGGPYLPQGVLFPGCGQLKQSCRLKVMVWTPLQLKDGLRARTAQIHFQ